MLEINLKNRAVAQTSVAYTSMCQFGDVFLGVDSSGLCKICGYDDYGTEIPALIKSGTFDLGIANPKRFRFFYFGVETSGSLILKVYCDDVLATSVTIQPDAVAKKLIRVPIPREYLGRYWTWSIENVDGAFFVLYSVTALPIILHPGRG